MSNYLILSAMGVLFLLLGIVIENSWILGISAGLSISSIITNPILK